MFFALWPSAFACSTIGGYISVNSWVSPATASCRFSRVVPTPPMFWKCASAWIVSASAAARKSRAICGKPSFSAFLA